MSEKEIFYDTDCLSCFISIDDVSILKELFEKVIIPYEVYEEFFQVFVLGNCRKLWVLRGRNDCEE